jgi:hypothetical protein
MPMTAEQLRETLWVARRCPRAPFEPEVGIALVHEVLHLRAQRDDLQARNTALVEERRALSDEAQSRVDAAERAHAAAVNERDVALARADTAESRALAAERALAQIGADSQAFPAMRARAEAAEQALSERTRRVEALHDALTGVLGSYDTTGQRFIPSHVIREARAALAAPAATPDPTTKETDRE